MPLTSLPVDCLKGIGLQHQQRWAYRRHSWNSTRSSPIQVLITFLGVKGKGLLTGFSVHLRFKLRTPLVNSFLLFASVPTGGQEQTVISWRGFWELWTRAMWLFVIYYWDTLPTFLITFSIIFFFFTNWLVLQAFLKTTFTSQSMYNNSDKDHCKNFGMSDDIAVGCCSGGWCLWTAVFTKLS